MRLEWGLQDSNKWLGTTKDLSVVFEKKCCDHFILFHQNSYRVVEAHNEAKKSRETKKKFMGILEALLQNLFG